jgi:Putative Ig domain/Right handed beta helix region/Domain of unknown function DUF11
MRRGLRFSMGRGLAPGASLAAAAALLAAGAVPAASSATVPSAQQVITAACQTRTARATITLTADCATAVTLTVPDGFTLNGAGHVITAHDPASGAFAGPVLTNAGPDMSITNLTVRGTEFTATCSNPRYGILLANGKGSITNVRVLNIARHGSCPLGIAIGIIAATGRHRTVTITGATASGFRLAGLLAEGNATVNVSHSTFGPPDRHVGNPRAAVVQNSVEYGLFAPLNGTGGTFTGNRVIGTAFGSARYASAALLLYHAAHLTVSGNIFSGAGTDAGIGIVGSANITISHNQISRPGPRPGFDDTYGLGVSSDDASRPETALICNTLAGWKQDLENIGQPPCIVTKTVPGGAVNQKYSAVLQATTLNPHPGLTWSVLSGALPPGLTLNSDGTTITGTPAKIGTYTFTARVSDPVEGVSTREYTITITPKPEISLHVTKTAAPAHAQARKPETFTFTVADGGPDAALGLTVDDHPVSALSGLRWTCAARGTGSRCAKTAGTGSINKALVDVAAGGTVTFKLTGTLPADPGGRVVSTVTVRPPPGAVDPACTPSCSASVTVPVRSAPRRPGGPTAHGAWRGRR